MINVDMKSLILHLNPYCTETLQAAAGLCVSRTHYEVTVEHFISRHDRAMAGEVALKQ